MGIVEQYLLQLNTEKQRFRRVVAILSVLSLLVVGAVSWNLRLTGVTLANDTSCGRVEHQHTDACPTEKVLVCGYDSETTEPDTTTELPAEASTEESAKTETVASADEATENPTEVSTEAPTEVVTEEAVSLSAGLDILGTVPPHIHTAECYEIKYLCGFEKHIHEISCYCDTTADVESAADWESTLPERTSNWDQDLVSIAQSQLGNSESERNFELASDGQTRNGITRYGQWYGNPYGDWSAMFAMFCLHYADVPQEVIPRSPGVDNMLRLAEDAKILSKADSSQADAGNILFLDTDDNAKADKIGIVTSVNEEQITLICGDWENAVSEVLLSQTAESGTNEPAVVGYIHISAQQDAYQQTQRETEQQTESTTEPMEKTVTEPATEPTEEAMMESTTAPTEEAVTEPTTEPTEESATESTTEPTEESATESTTEPTEESATEPTTEPTEEAVTESTTEPTEEAVMESTTAPTEEAVTESTIEPTEEAAAEPTTEPTEEAAMEPTTEPTEEAVTEPTTEPTEEAAMEPTTEPTEEAETESITEPTLENDSDTPRILLDLQIDEENQLVCFTAQLENIDDAMYCWQWQVSEDGSEPWTDIEGVEGLYYETAATEESTIRYYRLQGRKQLPIVTFAIMRNQETTTDEESGTITSEAVSPFSINKNYNTYTIDVYALPVDANGNRISSIAVTDLDSLTVNSTTKVAVSNKFNTSLGTYKSAYFGTPDNISADNGTPLDNIESVWRYYRNRTYYLAYARTDGTQNQRWKSSADESISLYLRYIPNFTVTFESEGFTSMTETVAYNGHPTLIEPGTWTREGYILEGWIIDDDERNIYTYDEIIKLPVTNNVTYTAKWHNQVTVSFDLGENSDLLYPVEPVIVTYGSTVPILPTPAWINNGDTMAFNGWYLDEAFTIPVTNEYVYLQDTTVYAKWAAPEDGYYVYFMDFDRGGQTPLVLMTYSVTEGKNAFPYTPGNAPADMDWNGNWYLDAECTQIYDFSIPVSQMTDYLTGVNGRDLYLYPGMQAVCRAIFVTYGTRIDPVTVPVGGTIDLDNYIPERSGYDFAGWILKDGTSVSGEQILDDTVTFYAVWQSGYVPFEAILRIENANDTGLTQADILGTWYAKAGSQIRVKSTYTGSGDNRSGTHEVVCVLDGVEYPVYTDAALTSPAVLSDVYETYYIYNNSGTAWSDEINWDDVYTGGELPYGTRPISSAGDTIINFDYMRIRDDLVFRISNSSAYIDVYKLYQNDLITGSVTYNGQKPTAEGQNVSATGVSGTNISWSYTTSSSYNLYTLHNVKYGQRIYEVYPVGGSWLSISGNAAFDNYDCNGTSYTSRREDLSSNFFSGSGRGANTYTLTAEFQTSVKKALMYAIECLPGETADFTINNVGYKVQTHLCEVVNSPRSSGFSAKELLGCTEGISNSYTNLSTTSSTIGGTSVRELIGTTYWSYYDQYNDVDSLSDLYQAFIFYYERLHMSIQFNFAYDSDGDGSNQVEEYTGIAFGQALTEYQLGKPGYEQNELLNREGYEFAGWLDANGFVLEAEDWESLAASGDSENSSMIFIAKWEKISNNIVEYYEDVSAEAPFESHYFDDGALLEYPTMTVYPDGWVWQEYGQGQYERFDWDVPMYGDHGVQEVRQINGEEMEVNVLRIYGTWDDSHTKVVYDPNAAQGGVPGTVPVDDNEYTIWQSVVSVMSRNETSNVDLDAIFVGWLLDRDGIVYQPGDHVSVRWPRTMIFTAQWAKAEEVVYLRYDPNGGSPEGYYPNDNGFNYKKGCNGFCLE